jgi:hypothetical protein
VEVEHWPAYEEITEKYYRQRYFYGEAYADRLRVGRIVRWYRTFNGIILTPIQPIVRYLDGDGREGEAEYVELGDTELHWIGVSAEAVRQAWESARRTGDMPQPHRNTGSHPANPFYVDPAHFLLFYGEPQDGRLVRGRVVGWDPPQFADELPFPMVRLRTAGGELDGDVEYVGTLYDPEIYWIVGSEEEVEQVFQDETARSR